MHASVIVVAAALAGVSAAQASLSANTSASQVVASATLAPPSALTAVAGPCTVGVSVAIALSWTATPSTWADGYEVLRSPSTGGPYTVVGTVASVSVTTYTDLNLPFSTTYYYVVRATKLNWRSVASNEVAKTTLSTLCQ